MSGMKEYRKLVVGDGRANTELGHIIVRVESGAKLSEVAVIQAIRTLFTQPGASLTFKDLGPVVFGGDALMPDWQDRWQPAWLA